MDGVVFRAEIWAVTRRGNHLVKIVDLGLDQVEGSGSHCQRPPRTAANQMAAEDLSHLSQLVNPTFVSGGLEDV